MIFLSSKTIQTLREKVSDLERDVKRLADEWDDMAALLRRRAGNAARQLARLEEAETRAQEPSGATNGEGPKLDPVSERILARRQRITNQRREVEQ